MATLGVFSLPSSLSLSVSLSFSLFLSPTHTIHRHFCTIDARRFETVPHAPLSPLFMICFQIFCRANRGYGLTHIVVDRTEMYVPGVRVWYESYFLSRRTLLIGTSLALSRAPVARTVSDIYCLRSFALRNAPSVLCLMLKPC